MRPYALLVHGLGSAKKLNLLPTISGFCPSEIASPLAGRSLKHILASVIRAGLFSRSGTVFRANSWPYGEISHQPYLILSRHLPFTPLKVSCQASAATL